MADCKHVPAATTATPGDRTFCRKCYVELRRKGKGWEPAKAKKRWWGLVVNGELWSVDYGTAKEVEENADISGIISCTNIKLPISISLVPVIVAVETVGEEHHLNKTP